MRLTLIILLISLAFSSYAGKRKNRFPAWTYHYQKNTNIHGLSIGLASLNDHDPKQDITSNGLKIELIGAGIFTMMSPQSPVADSDSAFQKLQKQKISETVNGIAIATTGSVCDCNINGINLGTIGHIQNRMNGISFALINLSQVHNGLKIGALNQTYIVNGAQIGIVINETEKMNGLQIAPVNKSKHTRGIQIGLWNINERRKLPLINWNFKSKTIG